MKKLVPWIVIALCAANLASVNAAPARSRTPIMGWSSWNQFRIDIDEEIIRGQADAMVTKGMQAAGYHYINIDDGFFGGRDGSGALIADDTKFPSGMKSLADYIHSKGLRAGIYSEAGTNTCGSIYDADPLGIGVGLYGHDREDLTQMLVEWGYDFIKVDWCSGKVMGLDVKQRYTEIGRIVRELRPDAVYNICRWQYPGDWAKYTADSWRISGDITATFGSVMSIVDLSAPLWVHCSPGHFNDMDMLQVGRGMTVDEDKAHFTMWCMMNSPLLAGNDLRSMSQTTVDILTNFEIIALNQDLLCYQARRLRDDGNQELWAKPLIELGGGEVAVTLLNRASSARQISFNLSEVGIDASAGYSIRDLWQHTTLSPSTVAASQSFNIPSHGVVVLRIKGQAISDHPFTSLPGWNYSVWANAQGLDATNGSPLDDPDGDTVINLIEYAFEDYDPLTPNTHRPFTIAMENDEMVARFCLKNTQDILITPQYQAGGLDRDGWSDVVDGQDGLQYTTDRYGSKITAPTSMKTTLFLRLLTQLNFSISANPNLSFEQPVVASGAWSSSSPLGWSFTDGGGVENVSAATRYGSVGQFGTSPTKLNGQGGDGNQVGYINISSAASATSEALVLIEPDTLYTLTVAFAQRTSGVQLPNGEIGLRALFDDLGTFALFEGGSFGTGFHDVAYSWISPGVGDPLIGQPLSLQMRFTYSSSVGGAQQAQFDRIRFTATRGASQPSPANGAINIGEENLTWAPAPGAVHYYVYVGTNQTDVLNATTASSQYAGTVVDPIIGIATTPLTTTYWRVDTITASGIQTGPLWSFTRNGVASISIDNSSFEQPILDPGAWSSISPPPGWSFIGNRGGVEHVADATRYGNVSNFGVSPIKLNGQGGDGNQVGYINVNSVTSAVSTTSGTNALIEPDTLYILTVAIGQRSTGVQLPDGEIGLRSLSTDLGTFAAFEGGTLSVGFHDVVYTWVSPAVADPLIGQPLSVHMRFAYSSSVGGAQQAQFDHVRLTTTRGVSQPSPVHGAIHVEPEDLSWAPAPGALQYQVFVGTNQTDVLNATTASPEYVGAVTTPSIAVITDPLAIIYWRVDAITSSGTVPGSLWSFTRNGVARIPIINGSFEDGPIAAGVPVGWTLTSVSNGVGVATGGLNGSQHLYIGPSAELTQDLTHTLVAGETLTLNYDSERTHVRTIQLLAKNGTNYVWLAETTERIGGSGWPTATLECTVAAAHAGQQLALRIYSSSNWNHFDHFRLSASDQPIGELDGWNLVWREEFNGQQIDWGTWSKVGRGSSNWNDTMTDDPKVFGIGDGRLHLKGFANDDLETDPSPFLTGGLTSRGKYSFQYGKIVIRARFDSATGAWPALWLLGNQGGWPYNGELDLMEHLNFDNFVYQTVHSGYNYTGSSTQKFKTTPINQNGYNTYGLEWDEWNVTFTCNGVQTMTYPRVPEQGDTQWPFDQPFYIILSMQIGGGWVGAGNPAHYPAEMEVDWIRVYERN